MIVEANLHLGVENKKHEQHISNPSTLLSWFPNFWKHRDYFENTWKKLQKFKLPFFLSENPDSSREILSFCKENINTLSTEALYSHIHNVIFPELVEKNKQERNNFLYNIEKMKKEFHVGKLTFSCVYWWVDFLGLKYESQKQRDMGNVRWYKTTCAQRWRARSNDFFFCIMWDWLWLLFSPTCLTHYQWK